MDTDTEYDFSSLNIEETIEPPPEPSKPKSDSLACIVCNTSITYGGRGPKPKYCADHKKQKTNSKPRSKKNTGTDYKPGILGMLQMPAAMLGIAGMKRREFAADSLTISTYAPGIAEALNELAQERPEVAAALDRVMQVGPYGALIASILPMALQLLTNHGIIPAGVMGTVPLDDIVPTTKNNEETEWRDG